MSATVAKSLSIPASRIGDPTRGRSRAKKGQRADLGGRTATTGRFAADGLLTERAHPRGRLGNAIVADRAARLTMPTDPAPLGEAPPGGDDHDPEVARIDGIDGALPDDGERPRSPARPGGGPRRLSRRGGRPEQRLRC